jgi:riboflavin kinase / FMN adenylyltransferase
MRIFRHIASIPDDLKGAVIAIGNFDGVHRGHQSLILKAGAVAKAMGRPLAVMVFEPTPQEYFNPGLAPFRLTPFHAKGRLIADFGADALFALPFDQALAHQSAVSFVRDTLARDLKVAAVAVGEDFEFGAGRGGDATLLAHLSEQAGFAAEIVPDVMAGAGYPGEKISSTLIRRLLVKGKTTAAMKLLGRPFSIEGTVEHGAARGRTLGFPTANVCMDGYIRPAFGIYAVRATLFENQAPMSRHDGVANVGIRPMYLAEKPLMEAFLFDFSADIYGRHIVVDMVAYIRPEAKFTTVERLIDQMNHDSLKAKAALERIPAG